MPIEFRDVYAGYRRREYVLKGVTCELAPGTLLLGPNGAGKTTMFRTILGLTPVAKGTLLIDGKSVDEISGACGVASANLDEVWRILPATVDDLAKLYIDAVGGDYDLFRSIIETFKADRLLGKKLSRLSAGERRIALNALALSLRTRYVLLDEPFENLDPRARAAMLKLVLENSSRIIMNTHATWLLDKLSGWRVLLVVGGKVFGPIEAAKLLNLGIVEGVAEDALLVLNLDDRKVSLVEGRGTPLSRMDSLDRLYEVFLT